MWRAPLSGGSGGGVGRGGGLGASLGRGAVRLFDETAWSMPAQSARPERRAGPSYRWGQGRRHAATRPLPTTDCSSEGEMSN